MRMKRFLIFLVCMLMISAFTVSLASAGTKQGSDSVFKVSVKADQSLAIDKASSVKIKQMVPTRLQAKPKTPLPSDYYRKKCWTRLYLKSRQALQRTRPVKKKWLVTRIHKVKPATTKKLSKSKVSRIILDIFS